MTYRELVELALEEDGPRFLTDGNLLRLATIKGVFGDRLLGEALLRAWLCRTTIGAPENAVILQICGLLGVGAKSLPRTDEAWSDFLRSLRSGAPQAAEYTRRHIGYFTRCHGLIPVVVDGEEALAVPFVVTSDETFIFRVRDIHDQPVPNWSASMPDVCEALGQPVGVQLLISCGRQISILSGQSFGFPVAVAHTARIRKLPDYPPTRLLLTGAVKAGGIANVSGIESKRKLARRMGAHFFAPQEAIETVGSDAGRRLAKAIDQLARELLQLEITRLSPLQTLEALKQLQEDLHDSVITPEIAKMRTASLVEGLADNNCEPSKEARILGNVIEASAANHLGDGDASDKSLKCAEELVSTLHDPLLYVDLRANEVVRLTDLFDLRGAEAVGRELLDFVRSDLRASANIRLRSEMTACGVLGGQPLVQLGLDDPELARESKELLEVAYQRACEIADSNEACRDITQIALWSAFHQPEQFENFRARALEVFANDPAAARTSQKYLANYRLSAARRRLLFGDRQIEPGFVSWDMPDKGSSAGDWLLATAHKYRGMLFAGTGQNDLASEEFQISLETMRSVTAPLLKLIHVSAAVDWLLAAERFQVNCPLSIGDVLDRVLQSGHPKSGELDAKIGRDGGKASLLWFARNFRY